MEITARHHGDILVLDMSGRLDTSTSGSAHDAIVGFAKPQPKKVVLNLDKLDYVSSAGLRVILTLAKLLQSSNGELKICRANANVNEVLQTSGFNSLIKMFDDERLRYRVVELIAVPERRGQFLGARLLRQPRFYFASLLSRVTRRASRDGRGNSMAKKAKVLRQPWTKEQLRELKMHSRAKTPVAKIAKAMKRTVGALRQKAFQLGLSLGHQR